MATYARIEGGLALDVVTADSAADAQALFGPVADAWAFIVVPDGTLHGAADNGDGTYTNPTTTPAGVPPVTLTKVAFMDHAYPCLGAGVAGIARYGNVISQARASVSDLVIAAMERYAHAQTFERDDVADFLDILVADPSVDLTQAERDLVVDGWPVQ